MYEYRWERRRIADAPVEVHTDLDVWLAVSDIFQGAERE